MPATDLKAFHSRCIAGLNARDFDTVATLIADDVHVNGTAYKRQDVSAVDACGRLTRGDETPSLYLSGHCLYAAEPYLKGPALMATLLAALDSVATHHAEAMTQLAQRRKRLEDLQLELARPFEHEDRLTDLLSRQRDLLKRLDLDKDEAGSTSVDAEEVRQAA